MFKLIIWTEENKTKNLALVSLDLDKRAKSCEGLKIKDSSIKKLIVDRSLAGNKLKKKNLMNERSLQNLI